MSNQEIEVGQESEEQQATEEQQNVPSPRFVGEGQDGGEFNRDESIADEPTENKVPNEHLKLHLEALLFAAPESLPVERLVKLTQSTPGEIRDALKLLADDYQERSIELREIASGYCFRVRSEYSPGIANLWQEAPPKYSRALLETLAIIAYRQPVTRAEIEEVRGVAVSSNLIKTLLELDWIKISGQREVPGRPSLFVTTREFLDHFNLKSVNDLPQVEQATQASIFENAE